MSMFGKKINVIPINYNNKWKILPGKLLEIIEINTLSYVHILLNHY